MAVISIAISMSVGGGSGDGKEVTREVPVTNVVTREVPTRRPTPINPFCFVAGTQVLTSTGYIAIEELQRGDTVLSYDHNFQTRVEANISPLVDANIAAVGSRQVNGLMRVELADGTTIRVTSEHPFYSPDEARYKPIGEFKIGERLAKIGQDGEQEAVVLVGIEVVLGEFTVYNLSVDNSHHNYVAAGVLVHNKTSVPTMTPTPTRFESADSYFSKGKEYEAAENWVMAISEFTNAIGVNPNYTYAYWMRGYSYAELGQDQNAINDYNNAIQIDPDEATLYNNRGYSYNELGQYQLAINDYTKAIQLDFYNAKAYKLRAIVYRNLGQTSQANGNQVRACYLDSKYC